MRGSLFISLLFLLAGLASCTAPKNLTRAALSDTVQARTGHALLAEKSPGRFDLPPSVNLSDGLSEEEAIAAALWNNAQYQTDLTAIAIAGADVVDAGLITNPLLRYILPGGGVSVSGYVNFAFDFLWQRPQRVAAAKAEGRRTEQRLIASGYTLIRDVQVAYADRILASRRAAIQAENLAVRAELARLNNVRFKYGDISELDATTTRADSAAAADDLVRAGLDTLLARTRLNALIGFPSPDTAIALEAVQDTAFNTQVEKEKFLALAYETQPQLRAAELAITSAGKRLGWERSRVLSFIAGTVAFGRADPGSGGTSTERGNQPLPNTFNPGIQAEVPIFNRNQGRIRRARAELEQAALQYAATRQAVTRDVTDAYNRYAELSKSYGLLSSGILPGLEAAVQGATSAYQRGDISYLPVLEAQRQLLNGRLRRADLEAELRRALAALNLSIGQSPPPTAP